ncbi:hypothetical protein EB796_008361 [Bugula neritina]|uniref:LRP2 n=1 Tax=Bugula neritina TaxID=10212 RepID=A0A7J7K596_BUGNE|nr:hypothetical protein EB796_008361 [Bugula neritina]
MSGILASVDFDGQGKQVVLHNLHFPHRLTIYEDQVFWADLHYGTVSAANKYTGSGRRVVYTNGGADKSRIFDVKLYDAFQETCSADSQCSAENNYGCCSRGAVCHPQESGVPRCVCEENFLLVNNGHQCVSRDVNFGMCSPNHFLCGDGSCIEWNLRCDSIADCADGSDEDSNFCACNPCDLNEFVCQNGQCIAANYACDMAPDFYPGCPLETDFQCKNALCISNHSVCDGVPDCAEHEDEKNCPSVDCATGLVACQTYPLCIHRYFLCNGQEDCVDGSDESITHCQAYTCQPGDYECDNRCMPHNFFCDGYCDCTDCSDEPNATCADQNR